MSRVLFLSLDAGEVVSRCLAADVGVSTIEQLPSGGVRLVCMSGDGAEAMRTKLKRHLLRGTVERQSHRPSAPTW